MLDFARTINTFDTSDANNSTCPPQDTGAKAMCNGKGDPMPQVDESNSDPSVSDEHACKRLVSCGSASMTGLSSGCPGKVAAVELGGDKTGC